jgi:uncharacterized protein YfaT (DUF1175 family)
MPVVSKDAVQAIGNQQYVFVATDKSNEFLLRQVKIARPGDISLFRLGADARSITV